MYACHHRALLATLGLCTLVALEARGEPTPSAIGPADPSSYNETETIPVSSALSIEIESFPPSEIVPMLSPAVDAGDKGSFFSDGGYPIPKTILTPGERAKLDMAREAVAKALANGTLPLALGERQSPALSEDEVNAIKLRRLADQHPQTIAADPVSGVGAEIPNVHANGAPELNEAERAKLEGRELPIPPAIVPTPEETRKEVR
jgi:hypothetical protein